MNYVVVYVQNQPMPVLFVSDGQINFVISSALDPGPVKVRVVSEGVSGPEVDATIVDAAPALFALSGGYAIATSADGKLLTTDAPAHAGDTIVVYATGLGHTVPTPKPGFIPNYAATIVALPSLKVTLAGKVVDPALIKYAGLTPGSVGLYQINLLVPDGTPADPEIEVTAGTPTGQAALKLWVR